MNYIVYTAIFGGKDKVENFVWRGDRKKCVCFTDAATHLDINPAITVVRCPSVIKENSVLSSKFFKVFPYIFFSSCDYSIWLDGNMRIKKEFDAKYLLNTHLKSSDIAVYAHPFRDCVYDELEGGLILKNSSYHSFEEQKINYQISGLPTHAGLAACGFILRRHTEALKQFSEYWWHEILSYTVRDQPGFSFTTWRLGMPYTIIPGSVNDNEYFTIAAHEK